MASYSARLFSRSRSAGVSSVVGTTGKTSTSQPDPRCAPLCTDCGMLECLCRPRFFAGQLLSEKDLNRLDQYIRGKNRLHNLQLFGWGVVNGLEVRCEPCGSGVVVGQGYALGPCGDDIVVCTDVTVDVCSLIAKCRPADNTCGPYQSDTGKGCDDVIEDWILAIRYDETPAKGVTALRMGPSCSCGATTGSCSCKATTTTSRCGCGAKAKSTCTCNARSDGSSDGPGVGKGNGCGKGVSGKPRGASPQCEPTVICEGYSFDVFPAPKEKTRKAGAPPGATFGTSRLSSSAGAAGGALAQKFLCCIQSLLDNVPEMPSAPTDKGFNENKDAWHLWCCEAKALFVDFFSNVGFDCTLADQISKAPCPEVKSATFVDEMATALEVFGILEFEAIQACICSALLPPAPCGTTEDRVPLALVRVRKKDCRVVEVCNWTPLRKIVLTFPTLEYWLSVFPFIDSLREVVHKMCCSSLFTFRTKSVVEPENEHASPTNAESGVASYKLNADALKQKAMLRANPKVTGDVAAKNEAYGVILREMIKRGATPLQPLDVSAGAVGASFGGQKPISDVEGANLPLFFALNSIVRPVATSLSPLSMEMARAMTIAMGTRDGKIDTSAMESGAARVRETEATPVTTEDVSALRETIAAMKERIDTLEHNIGKRK